MLKTIGLFPAAGHATRLKNSLINRPENSPCSSNQSKEILTVPDFNKVAGNGDTLAVGDYLVQAYAEAGINDIIIIRRPEKNDIATHYSHDRFSALSLQHVLTESTPGTPHTLLKAFHLYQHQQVALGFPDIILQAPGLFEKLQATLRRSAADVCLALFPAAHPANCDTVATHGHTVTGIEIKNPHSPHPYSWYCAVWQPRFSRFFYTFVNRTETMNQPAAAGELYVGHVFQAALLEGFNVSQVTFDDGLALDIGRQEDLHRARAMRPG